MVSQTLIKELDAIMVEDYSRKLEPRELADLADSLSGFLGCLAEIEQGEVNKDL